MRMPLSWLSEITDVPAGFRGADVAAGLVSVGLEEEDLHGGDLTGPLVVGRVLELDEQVQKNGKPIRYCVVDVGQHGQMVTEGKHQEIVCGATNFAVGDLVVVVLPGAVLPGGFAISARKTYGRMSNGMICAEDEIGLGHDHAGIIVLQRLLGEQEAAALQPGDDAIALLGLAEETVETNVTPDRGYCFSVRGLAREYWHSQGSPQGGYRDPAAVATPAANDDGHPVRIEDASPLDGVDGCDRFVARTVRGIDPAATSPSWLQKRLTQMGMRPISLAVDVTNYVMLAVGQPLHAYDLARLDGPLVVRRARAGETLTTLDEVERALAPGDLLITDSGERALAIAGVMGGASSEVGPTTSDVSSRPPTSTRPPSPAPRGATGSSPRPRSASSVVSTPPSPPRPRSSPSTCSSSTAAAPSTPASPTSTARARPRPTCSTSRSPAASSGSTTPASGSSGSCATSAPRRRDGRRRRRHPRARHPAVVAARPRR